MLEQIVEAVQTARIAFFIKQVETATVEWIRHESQKQESKKQNFVPQLPSNVKAATIVPNLDRLPDFEHYHLHQDPDEVIITYVSPHEQKSVTYVMQRHYYKTLIQYKMPNVNVFYVHVPPWATVHSATRAEMGDHILGTAHLPTGQIRLLNTLNPAEKTEVLLHETLHLLYPWCDEGQIRSMTRNIIGKQYCHFH